MPTTHFRGKEAAQGHIIAATRERTRNKLWPLLISLSLAVFICLYLWWRNH